MLAQLLVVSESMNFTSGRRILAPPTNLIHHYDNSHHITLSHAKQYPQTNSFTHNNTISTTNVSTAIEQTYTQEAGITAAAGTRLSLP